MSIWNNKAALMLQAEVNHRDALTDQKIKTAQAWAMVDRMESLVYWIANYAYPNTGLYPDDIKMAREIIKELEARKDRG